MTNLSEVMKQQNICVVVPTYNNAGTVVQVLQRILDLTDQVIVVIDGCTDNTRKLLETFPEGTFYVVDYEQNRGKGHALVAGFKRAVELGYDYAITIDSDGQHFPEDIPLFVEVQRKHPGTLIVGSRNMEQENMPGENIFANKFSNFWFTLQTGHSLPDTQTGYRLYPLHSLSGMRWITSRYEAELELLVFAAWKGVPLVSLPVRVYYPPKGERITHFRPYADFGRITVLNTILCFMAVVYGWPRILLRKMFHRK